MNTASVERQSELVEQVHVPTWKRALGCHHGWTWVNGRQYDHTTVCGHTRWDARHKWELITDRYPKRLRYGLANCLSRIAFRLRGVKPIDTGYGIAGNRAEALATDLVCDVLLRVEDPDERTEMIDRINELGRIAKAETCGLMPKH